MQPYKFTTKCFMLYSPTLPMLRGLAKHSKCGDYCYLFSDTLPLRPPYRSPGRTEPLLHNPTDYFCCVHDPKQRKMKHNHSVGYEAGEEQTRASGMAGRQWPGLGFSFDRSDFIPRCCALTSEWQNCIPFIFPQVKQRWYQLRDPWGERVPKPNKYCWL